MVWTSAAIDTVAGGTSSMAGKHDEHSPWDFALAVTSVKHEIMNYSGLPVLRHVIME